MTGPDLFDGLVAFGRELIAQTFGVHPVLWSGFTAGLVCAMGAAFEIAEHRGWRAVLWMIAGACVLAACLAVSHAEGSGASLGSGPS